MFLGHCLSRGGLALLNYPGLEYYGRVFPSLHKTRFGKNEHSVNKDAFSKPPKQNITKFPEFKIGTSALRNGENQG